MLKDKGVKFFLMAVAATVFDFPFIALASDVTEFNGTVRRVVCHVQDVSSVCQVQMNEQAPALACATSSWRYTFVGNTPEGKNILAILLAAQVSKSVVTVGGKGSCLLSPGSEDLRHVYLNTPSS